MRLDPVRLAEILHRLEEASYKDAEALRGHLQSIGNEQPFNSLLKEVVEAMKDNAIAEDRTNGTLQGVQNNLSQINTVVAKATKVLDRYVNNETKTLELRTKELEQQYNLSMIDKKHWHEVIQDVLKYVFTNPVFTAILGAAASYFLPGLAS